MLYKGKVTIVPKTGVIQCDMILQYEAHQEQTEVSLLLNENFHIKQVETVNIDSYSFQEGRSEEVPFVLESRKLVISYKKPLQRADKVDIHISYEGTIDQVTQWGINRIEEDFIELGVYTPWFPLTLNLSDAQFDIQVTIPEEYTVVNGGIIDKLDNETWLVKQLTPSNDCSILAFKNIKIIGNDHLKVYYQETNQEEIAFNLFETANLLFNYFRDLFGDVHLDKHLSIVLAPRNEGGGYGRKGMIVLTLDKWDLEKYFGFIAHEISHLWWNKAEVITWEDWLNESFAEYSALIAIRDHRGITQYNTKINAYKKVSEDLPPIQSIMRSEERAYDVLYKKGPTILYQLEQLMGRPSFINLLELTHKNQIKKTEQFIELLSTIEETKIVEEFKLLFQYVS